MCQLENEGIRALYREYPCFFHQSTLSSLFLLLAQKYVSFGFISMNQIFFYIKFPWQFLIWVFLIYI